MLIKKRLLQLLEKKAYDGLVWKGGEEKKKKRKKASPNRSFTLL